MGRHTLAELGYLADPRPHFPKPPQGQLLCKELTRPPSTLVAQRQPHLLPGFLRSAIPNVVAAIRQPC